MTPRWLALVSIEHRAWHAYRDTARISGDFHPRTYRRHIIWKAWSVAANRAFRVYKRQHLKDGPRSPVSAI